MSLAAVQFSSRFTLQSQWQSQIWINFHFVHGKFARPVGREKFLRFRFLPLRKTTTFERIFPRCIPPAVRSVVVRLVVVRSVVVRLVVVRLVVVRSVAVRLVVVRSVAVRLVVVRLVVVRSVVVRLVVVR